MSLFIKDMIEAKGALPQQEIASLKVFEATGYATILIYIEGSRHATNLVSPTYLVLMH